MHTSNSKKDFLFEDTNKKLYCEKYLKIIVNASLDGITVLDEQGKFEFANDSFFRITGWPKEEIIGQFFLKMIPEDAREFVMEHWKGIQTDHGGYHEIKIITKSGIIKYLNVSSSLVDINGQNKIIAIVHDISENKRYEINLEESEARYRDLFENAQDAMYVLDSESNFLKMNKVGIQTLGCTTEEVIGSNISKWVTPNSLRIINERRKKRLSGENVNQADIIEIVCKNNEHRWVEIRTRVIRSDNGTIEIHGIARDITENRLLKKELSKSNKQRKLLCYLIQGTRGGKTRALILKHLSDRPYNANQLARTLNRDYKTIRHHLNVLLKNGVITKNNDAYNISRNIESDLNEVNIHTHRSPAAASYETPE